jgi:hypothetical protein
MGRSVDLFLLHLTTDKRGRVIPIGQSKQYAFLLRTERNHHELFHWMKMKVFEDKRLDMAPWTVIFLIKNLWCWKAQQFRIYGSSKCYTWPPINNFIVIKNSRHRKAQQLPPSPLRLGARTLPRVHIHVASTIQARSSHAVIYVIHTIIILRLVPTHG